MGRGEAGDQGLWRMHKKFLFEMAEIRKPEEGLVFTGPSSWGEGGRGGRGNVGGVGGMKSNCKGIGFSGVTGFCNYFMSLFFFFPIMFIFLDPRF